MELKYRTREFNLSREGEFFALRDQGAQDISRYDFLKDIQRLERLRTLPNARAGFAILLTNDPSYWKPPSRPTTVGAAFRLQEGRRITGEMFRYLGPSSVPAPERLSTVGGLAVSGGGCKIGSQSGGEGLGPLPHSFEWLSKYDLHWQAHTIMRRWEMEVTDSSVTSRSRFRSGGRWAGNGCPRNFGTAGCGRGAPPP